MGRPSKAPTERDRFWLEHEAKLAASGGTAKTYAAEQGLSLHAFYQARKRLRALALLEAGAPRRSPKEEKAPAKTAARPVAFSRVEIRSPRPAGGELEGHLRRLLREYVDYYNAERAHTVIGDAPESRAPEPPPSPGAEVVALPRVGGLHHRYAWRDAA